MGVSDLTLDNDNDNDYDDDDDNNDVVKVGREWVRAMSDLTSKYQTKLEEVQEKNKQLRVELSQMQV